MIDKEILALLACPLCRGQLEACIEKDRSEGLVCRACALVFPSLEGIQILLPEEGVPLGDWLAGARKRKA